MANTHGKDTFVSFDGTDFSSFLTDSSFSRSADSHETTTYGNDDKTYIAGLRDTTFSFEGKYDDGSTNPTEDLEDLLGSATLIPVVRRVEGTGTGLPEHTFSGVLTSLEITNPVGGEVTFSGEIQVSGAVTRGDQA